MRAWRSHPRRGQYTDEQNKKKEAKEKQKRKKEEQKKKIADEKKIQREERKKANAEIKLLKDKIKKLEKISGLIATKTISNNINNNNCENNSDNFPLRGWLRHARKLAYIVFSKKFNYKHNISSLASMALAIPGGGR